MNQQAIIYVWKLRASWEKKIQTIFFNAVVIPNMKKRIESNEMA